MSSNVIAANVAIMGPALDSVALRFSEHVCQSTQGTDFEYQLAGCRTTAAPSHRGFAHVTLAQLFACCQDDLVLLQDSVSRAVETALTTPSNSCITLSRVHDGPVFDTATDGAAIRLPSLVVDAEERDSPRSSSFVRQLHHLLTAPQSPLHGIASRAMATCEAQHLPLESLFAEAWPGNTASATWARQFLSHSSGERYFPHVTLGAARNMDALEALNQRWRDGKEPVLGEDCGTLDHDRVLPFWDAQRHVYDIPLRDDNLRVAICHMGNFCSCNNVLWSRSLVVGV